MRRSLRALALIVGSALLLAGCTGVDITTDQPRPVTADEAQLVAIARFNNFDAGSRPFSTDITIDGDDLGFRGWVDYFSQVGYAAVTGRPEPLVLAWSGNTAGFLVSQPDDTGDPVLPIPSLDLDGWSTHEIDPTKSALDAVIATLSALGSDRPDNPLLLQQSGALWIRSDSIDGTDVDVFATPPSDEVADGSAAPITEDSSPLRLWLDDRGLVLRVELRVGADWLTIDMPNRPGESLTLTGSGAGG